MPDDDSLDLDTMLRDAAVASTLSLCGTCNALARHTMRLVARVRELETSLETVCLDRDIIKGALDRLCSGLHKVLDDDTVHLDQLVSYVQVEIETEWERANLAERERDEARDRIDVLNQRHEEDEAYRQRADEERDEARAENECDACGGTGKPASGKPCMCLGTGKMSIAALTLRHELVEARAERDEAMTVLAKPYGYETFTIRCRACGVSLEGCNRDSPDCIGARARRAKEK